MTPDTLGEIYGYTPTANEWAVAAGIFGIGFAQHRTGSFSARHELEGLTANLSRSGRYAESRAFGCPEW